MIFKLVALMGIGFLIYIVFFKKSRENSINKKDKIDEVDTMFECPSCKTYIAKDEAILSNGKYYCSKECLGK